MEYSKLGIRGKEKKERKNRGGFVDFEVSQPPKPMRAAAGFILGRIKVLKECVQVECTKLAHRRNHQKYMSSSAIVAMAYKSLFRILALIYRQHWRVSSLNASSSLLMMNNRMFMILLHCKLSHLNFYTFYRVALPTAA